MARPPVTVRIDGRVVCERCLVADRPWARMRACSDAGLPRGEGILLRPAGSIHTFFMRFPIDAVFVDRERQGLGVERELAPWRTAAAAAQRPCSSFRPARPTRGRSRRARRSPWGVHDLRRRPPPSARRSRTCSTPRGSSATRGSTVSRRRSTGSTRGFASSAHPISARPGRIIEPFVTIAVLKDEVSAELEHGRSVALRSIDRLRAAVRDLQPFVRQHALA